MADRKQSERLMRAIAQNDMNAQAQNFYAAQQDNGPNAVYTLTTTSMPSMSYNAGQVVANR